MKIGLHDVLAKNLDLSLTVADFLGTGCEHLLTLLFSSPGILLDKAVYRNQRWLEEDEAYYLTPFDAVGKSLRFFRMDQVSDSNLGEIGYGYHHKRRYVDKKQRIHGGYGHEPYPIEGMRIHRGGFFSKIPLSYLAQPIAAVVGTIVSLASFTAVAAALAVTQLALLCLSPLVLLIRSCLVGAAKAVQEIHDGCDLAYSRPNFSR